MDLNLKETVKAIYLVSQTPLRYLCVYMLATTSVNFRVFVNKDVGCEDKRNCEGGEMHSVCFKEL